MESFFGTMKKEELYRYRYRSERELKESIKAFVERYNSERPHEKLKYKTPNQYEDEYFNSL